MRTVIDDVRSHTVTLIEAAGVAQNRPLAANGAVHCCGANQK